jgi:hypothetical protein
VLPDVDAQIESLADGNDEALSLCVGKAVCEAVPASETVLVTKGELEVEAEPRETLAAAVAEAEAEEDVERDGSAPDAEGLAETTAVALSPECVALEDPDELTDMPSVALREGVAETDVLIDALSLPPELADALVDGIDAVGAADGDTCDDPDPAPDADVDAPSVTLGEGGPEIEAITDALSLPPELANALVDGIDAVGAADGDTCEDADLTADAEVELVAEVDLEAVADAFCDDVVEDELVGDTEAVAALLSVSVSDGSGVVEVELEAAAVALGDALVEDEPESDADTVAASLIVCVGVDASLVERVAVPPPSEFVSVGVDAAESDDVTLGEGSALALPRALTDGETQTIILKEKVTLVAFA